MRRSLTVLILVGTLLVLAISPALAHPRHNSCQGLNQAAGVTHERDPHGHDVVHDIVRLLNC